MTTICRDKHIEEYCEGQPNDIAADALVRVLRKHDERWIFRGYAIQILGCGNIVTDSVKSHMKLYYPKVTIIADLPLPTRHIASSKPKSKVMLITELKRSPRVIRSDMIHPNVKVLIDMGYHVNEDQVKTGDICPEVLKEDGLMVTPTPGGILPIIPWLMIERSIRAKLACSPTPWDTRHASPTHGKDVRATTSTQNLVHRIIVA